MARAVQVNNAFQRPVQGAYRVVRKKPKYQGLAGQYQQALDKANAANENRYNQILGGYDQLHSRVMGDLANVGAMEKKDINRQYNSMGSDVYQRLVNRGFGNSSLTGTMQMGVERERADALARSAERAAQLRANADMQLSTGKFGVMERRTDMGPDPNQLLEIARLQGQTRGIGLPRYGTPIGMVPGQAAGGYQAAMARHMAGAMAPFAGRQPSSSRRSVYGARDPGPAMARRASRARQRYQARNRLALDIAMR